MQTELEIPYQPVALITGSDGFCGQHLARHLAALGCQVAGLDRCDRKSPGLTMYTGDVTDAAWMRAVLAEIRPDTIFHLAALTDPALGYQQLHRVNALGTLALLQAVRQACPGATVLVTSSSAVYGLVARAALPIGENQPFNPSNPYAVSKIAQEMVTYQQFAAHGLRVIRTRAFNLTGPGESANFATSAFARQMAEIEAGLRQPVLYTGNLEAVRDFTDVRDAVRAYRLLAESGDPGQVYNVCSGQGTPIRYLLDTLLDLSQVCGISVQLDPTRLQVADVPIQIGDAAMIHGTTGWEPTILIRQTLQDVLDYWRHRIANRSEA